MKKSDLLEFSNFLNANGEPSAVAQRSLVHDIRQALNPSAKLAFLKVLLLSTVGSFATLLLCPQFGSGFMGPLGMMSHFFMDINPNLCFFICGGIWMLPGYFLVSVFLTIDELRVMRRLYVFAPLTTISMSLLYFANSGSLTIESWTWAWLAGALAIGAAGLGVSYKRLRRISLAAAQQL